MQVREPTFLSYAAALICERMDARAAHFFPMVGSMGFPSCGRSLFGRLFVSFWAAHLAPVLFLRRY